MRLPNKEIKSDLRFSIKSAYLYGIIFALVGAFILLRGLAAPAQPQLAKGAAVTCATADQEAPLLAAAGIKWVRIQTLSWAGVETARSVYNNDRLDKFKSCFDTYHAYGIKILLLVDNTPQWAAQNPNRQQDGKYFSLQPPANDQDLADLFSYMVPYLGDSVDAWEIYNEPNLGEFFQANNPQPDYLGMLKASYSSIKAADQKAGLSQQVIMSGLAMIYHAAQGGWSDSDWTDYLFSNGAYKYTDALTLHPYPDCTVPSNTGIYAEIHNDRQIADQHQGSRAQIPLWFTEFDYAGCSSNQSTQASLLTKFYNYYDHGAGKSDNLAVANWFTGDGVILGDTNSGVTTTCNQPWWSSRILDDPYVNPTKGPWQIGPQTGLSFKDVKVDWGDGTSEKQMAANFTHVYKNYDNYTTHITMDFTSGLSESFNCTIVVRLNTTLGPADCPSIQLSDRAHTVTAAVGQSPWLTTTPIWSALKAWPSGVTAPVMDSLSVSGSGSSLSVSATAHSDYNNIAKVDFYNAGNNSILQTATSSPFSLDLSKLGSGTKFNVYARATDYLGNTSAKSQTVNFQITDTSPPSVAITSPKAGTTLSNQSVVSAKASDNVAVSHVEFYLDGVKEADDSTSPYNAKIIFSKKGSNVIRAVAYDAAGNSSSDSVTVNVEIIDKTAPTVTITSPDANSLFRSGDKVGLLAQAKDDSSGVASVQFYYSGNKIGDGIKSGTSASNYSYDWEIPTGLASGFYKITAVATDGAGNTATSSSVPVQIDNNVPTVSVASPVDGANISGKNVSITASASDNVGVKSVSYTLVYPDGTTASLGPLITASPYNYTWDTTGIANGNYKLLAVATDKAGNTSTSKTINVTINNVVVPPPDTTKPSKPTGLQVVAASTSSTNLSWQASTDNKGGSGIKDYKVYRDGSYIGSTTTLSYSDSNLSSFTNYSYQVSAEDNAANESAKSAKVNVKTKPPTPDVSLSGQSGLRLHATATITADASSIAGVASVQFILDYATTAAANLGLADTTSPYTLSFDTTQYKDGVHTITAIATDSTGQQSKPSTFSVVIDNTAPAVLVSTPKNKAKIKNSVRLLAAASDNDGVAGVQFMLDGKSFLGSEISQKPYAYVWDTTNFADGDHTITAVAYDLAGNSTTSSVVNITLTNKNPSTEASAPSIPTSLAASQITATAATLSWSPSTDSGGSGVGGYIIYRNGQVLVTTTKTTYSDKNLTPGSTYSYSVAAFDNAGNTSDKSPAISLTTQSIAVKPGDANGDGKINISDLSIVLSAYGRSGLRGDFNHDGKINIIDLSILLSNYGK